MHVKSLHLCLTLCDPMDYSPPAVHGSLQARILEWVAISFSRGELPNPGMEPGSLTSPALASKFFTTSTKWEVQMILVFINFNKFNIH